MFLTRLIRLLFPGIFPLYSGGGGSGGTATQKMETVTNNTPWAASQPYLKQGLSEVQRLYTLGPQKYTPWAQVAGFTPDQLAAQQGIIDYVNAPGTQNLMSQGTNAVSNLMGPSAQANVAQYGQQNLAGYLGNNRLADTAEATNRLMYGDTVNPYTQSNVQNALDRLTANFQRTTLPGLRRQAIGSGTYGSSRNELAEAQAAADLGSQMYDTSTNAWQNAYNTAEANRLGSTQYAANNLTNQMELAKRLLTSGQGQNLENQRLALSNFGNQMNLPLSMLENLYGVGAARQAQTQAGLTDATNRWNFDQQAAWDNLMKYRNLVDLTAGLGGSTSGAGNATQTQILPTYSTGANVAGGLISGLGLLGALYGRGGQTPAGTSSGVSNYGTTPSTSYSTFSNAITPQFQSGRY